MAMLFSYYYSARESGIAVGVSEAAALSAATQLTVCSKRDAAASFETSTLSPALTNKLFNAGMMRSPRGEMFLIFALVAP
jgi:hypothetical protein